MGLPVLQRKPDLSQVKTAGSANLGDLLRIKNLDDVDYEFPWDSVSYRVPANGDGVIPFEAVANWFGDPRSASSLQSIRDQSGRVGFVPDRATEVRRLWLKYGNEGAEADGKTVTWPNVEIYDLDGNRVLTVLDDPEGTAILPAPQPTIADSNSMLDQIKRLEKQVQALMNDGRPVVEEITPPKVAGIPVDEEDEDKEDEDIPSDES